MAYKHILKCCEYCGREYIDKYRTKFCSRKCANKANKDKKYYCWKGEITTLKPLHRWVTKQLGGRPDSCSKCGKKAKVDLANKSNQYKRDLDDWEWLCRRCHMESDGRLSNFLSHSNMHNKVPDMICPQCGESFEPRSRKRIFCSKSCRATYHNLHTKIYPIRKKTQTI